MNIILIGFMGSGKTSLGIRLSYKLKQPFLDTDKEIERINDKTIKEIFSAEGEESFRRMETDYIRGLLDKNVTDHVISTGGGTPLRDENMEILKELGVVVWLRITPDTVFDRLKNDTNRPLLQTEDPASTIERLLEFRNPLYEKCSDVIIDVDNKPVERIMDEVFTKSAGVYRHKKRIHRSGGMKQT